MAKYLSIIFMVLAAYLVTETTQSRRVRDVGGSPQTNGRIADYAMKALSSFQRFMKEGNSDLGIPVLDPVHMESFNYSLVNAPVGFRMEIQFNSPVLMGLSNYELSSASELTNADGNKILMTIVFPNIQVKGSYTASGDLFGFFSLAGLGDFNIVASSQVLSAEAKLAVFNDTLVVEKISSQFVGGRVKSHFTDNTSSGPFAGLLSEFLSAMGTQVFDKKLKPVITVAMNDYTKEWLNGAFSSVQLNELLGQQQHQQQQQPHPQPQPQSQPQIQQGQPQALPQIQLQGQQSSPPQANQFQYQPQSQTQPQQSVL